MEQAYPQVAAVGASGLPVALKDLARQGALDVEIKWAITQLQQLHAMSEAGDDPIAPGHAYQFLALAEGAIHAILRGTPASRPDYDGQSAGDPPVRPSWHGVYNNGSRTVSFDGEYRATASDATMSGAWYRSSGRRIANFEMVADTAPSA